MKSSGEGTTRPAKPNPLATVSERKLTANRENAKKSTGPKTPRGKALSRRNALKHGLLAKVLIPCFPLQGENQQELEDLLDDLMHDYKPCGAAEELEVERIAACRWRLMRAWRYENAEILLGQVKILIRGNIPPPMSDAHQTALRLLQDAEKKVEAGQGITQEEPVSEELISQELKKKVFAALPSFQEWWPKIEESAQKYPEFLRRGLARFARRRGKQMPMQGPKKIRDQTPNPLFDHDRLIALMTIRLAISIIEFECKQYFDSVMKHAYELEAIPNRDVVEKLLRYETGFERSLDRAVDRLERLQRHRKGEPIPTR